MKKRALLGIFLLAMSANASARSFVNAQVTRVRIDASGIGMIFFDVSATNVAPQCVHPDYLNALAFDANTASGKAILAAALSAKAQGTEVHVNGGGACNIYGGQWVEDWGYGLL